MYYDYPQQIEEEIKPKEPVKCWCGLRAAGQGGIHSDYCHEDLAGKSELPPQ